MTLRLGAAALLVALAGGATSAAPLTLPFDFSHGELGLTVRVNGEPLYVIIDTGVDPSAIDIGRAEALHLKIDRGAGGEASGEGNDKQAKVFPTAITGLSIGGRDFAPVDALALDMGPLSKQYGRPLDAVLGYSFLTDKIILLDYPAGALSLLDRPDDALASVRACRTRWSIPLRSFKDDSIPVIPAFRFGAASAPISLDTGSNGAIALFEGALALPGLREALVETGETTYMGARGKGQAKTYTLAAPVGFGPFSLPAGQSVRLLPDPGSADTRLANIGNKLFAQMKLKILLDYRGRLMTFYGDCR
jgi:hypothetical protein